MSEVIDPSEYIITRKRKKYKFAMFHNAVNCFEFDEWQRRHVDVVEIGAGTGQFSVALAEKYPGKVFVAVDVKADRLQKGAYLALEKNLTNIFFLRARADQITALFAHKSLETVWLTFPDPFPKARSAGRRLTHPHFLAAYEAVLKPGGTVCLKHDNREFFLWSLEQLVYTKWTINELSFDLHESDLSEEYKVLTAYEERWLSEGFPTNFVKASNDLS